MRPFLFQRRYDPENPPRWCVWLWRPLHGDYVSGIETPVVPYLLRLYVVMTQLFSVCLHWINSRDPDADPHDHQRAFVSIVLRGWYREEVYQPVPGTTGTVWRDEPVVRTVRWINFKRATGCASHRRSRPADADARAQRAAAEVVALLRGRVLLSRAPRDASAGRVEPLREQDEGKLMSTLLPQFDPAMPGFVEPDWSKFDGRPQVHLQCSCGHTWVGHAAVVPGSDQRPHGLLQHPCAQCGSRTRLRRMSSEPFARPNAEMVSDTENVEL